MATKRNDTARSTYSDFARMVERKLKEGTERLHAVGERQRLLNQSFEENNTGKKEESVEIEPVVCKVNLFAGSGKSIAVGIVMFALLTLLLLSL